MLLDLEVLQLGGFLGKVGVDEVADAAFDHVAQLAGERHLGREREILERRVFGEEADGAEVAPDLSKDRVRQIGKRASRIMAELAAVHPRFEIMADSITGVAAPARPGKGVAPVALVALGLANGAAPARTGGKNGSQAATTLAA